MILFSKSCGFMYLEPTQEVRILRTGTRCMRKRTSQVLPFCGQNDRSLKSAVFNYTRVCCSERGNNDQLCVRRRAVVPRTRSRNGSLPRFIRKNQKVELAENLRSDEHAGRCHEPVMDTAVSMRRWWSVCLSVCLTQFLLNLTFSFSIFLQRGVEKLRSRVDRQKILSQVVTARNLSLPLWQSIKNGVN